MMEQHLAPAVGAFCAQDTFVLKVARDAHNCFTLFSPPLQPGDSHPPTLSHYRDAFLQHVLQGVGAAMVAASPFVFVYQFLG
jgi:hypothetical protein